MAWRTNILAEENKVSGNNEGQRKGRWSEIWHIREENARRTVSSTQKGIEGEHLT